MKDQFIQKSNDAHENIFQIAIFCATYCFSVSQKNLLELKVIGASSAIHISACQETVFKVVEISRGNFFGILFSKV